MENITRILWEHDDDTFFAWRMSLLWNICNKIRVEYPDKVTEPFIRIRKILAWLDIRYQTHHGAIGAVLRHRIPEDEPLHMNKITKFFRNFSMYFLKNTTFAHFAPLR